MKKNIICLAILAGLNFQVLGNNNEIPKAVFGSALAVPTVEKRIPAAKLVGGHPHVKSTVLNFELNKGQWPQQVSYKSDIGQGRRIYFEKDRFTYVMYDHQQVYKYHEQERTHLKSMAKEKVDVHAFEMKFVNANPLATIEGAQKLNHFYNYYLGNDQSRWASEVPAFSEITYKELYNGIDLHAFSKDHQLKYDYVIKPSGNAGDIKLSFEGAEKVFVRNNTLYILTSVGEVVETMPYSYQLIEGKEVKVQCEYLMGEDGTVSFHLPNGYNKNYELIIDPVVMASTYTGSTANTFGHCATYDPTGNIYTGGRAFSQGYPTSLGAFQSTFGGGVDMAISKMNPTGTAMIYSTYVGGNDEDYPHSLFVHNNELYIYGSTTSQNYPTSTGCYDNTHNGNSDIVITKLVTNGTALVGSTYVGGSAEDGINNNAGYNYGDTYRGEIVVNSSGEPFIAGTTDSQNFPVTTGAYDVTHNGAQDAVLFKMNANLTSLVWATFLGGSNEETGCSLRLNPAGDVYIVGITEGGGFPVSSGALTTTYQGGQHDGYVARFNSTGTTLISSTYIGTSFLDIVYFMDLDFNNDVYIYGVSTGAMPISSGAYSNPGSQTFLMKLNPGLTTALYSTVLGNGSHNSFSPSAFMVDLCQNVYLAGWGSTTGFPITSNAVQSTTDNSDFHIMVLNANATTLVYGTFYGPSGFGHVDGGTSRFDPNGLVYQAVCECGNAFPTLPNSVSNTNNSPSCDVAVFKIDFQLNCNPLMVNTTICYGSTASLSLMNLNNLTNATYSIQPGGTIQSSPIFTVSPTTNQSYTLYITGTNYLNATMTSSGVTNVSVTPQPFLSPTFTQAACITPTNAFNLGLTFAPLTPTLNYTVNWFPTPNGVTSATQTSATGGINPGPYSVTVTASNGCKVSTNFTMNPTPTTVTFSIIGSTVVTCANPTVAFNINPSTHNYTWTSNSAVFSGPTVTLGANNAGSFVVTAQNPESGCVATQTFNLATDLTVPTSTVVPLVQNVTCSLTSIITVTASGSISTNLTHYWISPYGGTLTLYNGTTIYPPGGPGTYTHVLVNNINGCSILKTFTVTSSSGFPTFSVTSPQNFTLGCFTRSVAIIDIIDAQTQPTAGGPVSYTILGPSSSQAYVTSTVSTFTNITQPGTWTVITKDNTNSCETKILISVLQNTFAPNIGVIVPRNILTCEFPTTLLQGTSTSTGVGYNWTFPGVPGNLPKDTIRINIGTNPSNTLIANYVLTVTDLNNTCINTTTVQMLQNTRPPNALFSGDKPLTCTTPSITLTNISTSNVPPVFNPNQAVVGYLWKGPSPQVPESLKTTYIAYTPGIYTLTARDNNNGCMSVHTRSVDDFRDYPIVNNPTAPPPFIFDCAAAGTFIYPSITSPTTSLTYSWIAVANASISSVSTFTTFVNKVGLYNVVVTNSLNGCVSTGVVEVIDGKLDAKFSVDPETGYAPLTVQFNNQSSSSSALTGTQGISSFWTFGNGDFQTNKPASFNPTTIYTQPGTYRVVLFVIKGTCKDTTARIVQVERHSDLEIPNVFTPNGDGSNDIFFVKATNLSQISAVIFDRWGQKVYEVDSNTGNIAWDGFNQAGVKVAEGVYFYVIKAQGRDGEKYDQEGTVTLLR